MSTLFTHHRILGVEVDAVSLSETIQTLQTWLKHDQSGPKIVFTPNPEILVYAHHHADFRQLLNSADLNLPDGTGVVWFSHGNIKSRVAGTDVVQALLKEEFRIGCVINPNGLSSKAEITAALPNAEIITEAEQFTSQPALVLVALGSPAQEQWIAQHRNLPGCRVLMAVGGSLDHLTGKQSRAPLIFQRFRLEWLWRLLRQPSRFKRIITATIVFPWLALTYSDPQRHD